MKRTLAALVALVTGVLIGVVPGAALAADSDGDGMPNRWERKNELNPNRDDADADPDRDKLTNLDEYRNDGDPHLEDTDLDGLGDGNEVHKWNSEVDHREAAVGYTVGDEVCDADGTNCRTRVLGGVRLTLKADGGGELSTISNEDGTFSFQAPKGRYTLTPRDAPGFVAPSAYEFNNRGSVTISRFIYAQSIDSGVVGQVTRSPTCDGPQRPDEDCVEPLEGASLRVEDANGDVVARTKSGPGGRYLFNLDQGSYTLIAEADGNSNFPSPPGPVDFTIVKFHEPPHGIDLDYDTGIR
jgi:hypothetical protein